MRLIQRFQRAALAAPDKTALVTERSQMSYRDILNLTQVLDIQLRNRGMREGQTIALDIDRGDLTIAFTLLLSLRSLNIIFAPVRPLIRQGIPIDYAVTTVATDDVPLDRQIVIEPDWFSMMGSIPLPFVDLLPGDGGSFITSTSGSTGTPKLVKVPETDKLRDMLAMSTVAPDRMKSVRFMTTSGANTGWAMNKNLPVLLGGGSIVSLGKDASQVLPFADLWHVTHLAVTPSVLQQALKLPGAGQYLTSVQEIEIGGAFCPESLLAATRAICDADLVSAYGATEVGALCRHRYVEGEARAEGYLGEVFRDDIELVILDEDLQEAPGATEGVLAVRLSGTGNRAYLGEADTEGMGLVGPLFVTGDLVRREGDSLFLTGRRKRIFNFNGNKYSLDLVQLLLNRDLPDGTEVAAIATRAPDGLEQLVVFHSGPADLTASEIEGVLRNQWAKIRLGSVVRVPDMPRTTSGKVDLEALRKLL